MYTKATFQGKKFPGTPSIQHNGKLPTAQYSKVIIAENQQPVTLTLPLAPKNDQIQKERLLPTQRPEPTTLILINEPKILIIRKEKEETKARSRGSSDSSQITLLTSLEKSECEGNNNKRTHSDVIQQNGKIKVAEPTSDSRLLRRCQCINCEKKNGFTKNKCLFRSKPQKATFESLAKKIRFFPNSTKSIFTSKNSEQGQSQKCKISKKLSTNTISNSSLQDMDESEFTSSELADVMGQLNEAQTR